MMTGSAQQQQQQQQQQRHFCHMPAADTRLLAINELRVLAGMHITTNNSGSNCNADCRCSLPTKQLVT
jgi:hypothetical protein